MPFESIQHGSKYMLGSTCDFLNSLNIEYVVIGGWSPFLRNNTGIEHPGTQDVDILFNTKSTPEILGNVIDKAIHNNNYLISAKQNFQLFKVLNVSNENYVFNVDLLHPNEKNLNGDMFVDQLSLNTCIDESLLRKVKMKSMVGPNSEILFYENFSTPIDIHYYDENRNEKNTNIHLLNETGCIISKAISCSNIKRTRDSFDIYISLCDESKYDVLIKNLLFLREKSPVEFSSLMNISYMFNNGKLLKNIKKYYPSIDEIEYRTKMLKFFHDIKISRIK